MANWIFDRFLRKISVRARMIGSFLLIMLLAGSISPVILYSLNTLLNRLEQVTNVDARTERLLLIASQRVSVSQFNLSRYIQDLTPSPFAAVDNTNQALQNLKEARKITNNKKQNEDIGLVIRSLEIYRQQITDLQKAHIAKDDAEVTRLESKLQQLGNDISARLEIIANENVKQVAATNDTVLSDARQSVAIGFTMIIVGFLLALLFSLLVSISVTRPLAELRNSAESFQQGNMDFVINVTGADELTVISKIFNELMRQVSELINSLENRVSVRTTELNNAVKYIERRAKQFEAITKVSQSISMSASLQELLPYTAEVISEQFGFYHVGIFLNAENNQYAILSAANSAGGKRMLARGHQLKVGEQGIVGHVTSVGEPRIALDVGRDVAYFNNPDLPETHSEMALPIRIFGKVAGALDIQSTESNAFSNEDLEVLSALADQVSLAIQNARLYDQTQKMLAEAEMFQRQYLRDTWSRLPKEEGFTGFRYSALGATIIKTNEEMAALDQAKKKTEINVPISLRGENIGTLNIQMPRHERVTSDQMDVIKAVAERVALSSENARLFDESQKRSSQLESLNELGRAVSQQIDLKSVLKSGYEQLSRIIPLDAYIIALTDDEKQTVQFPLVIDEGVEFPDDSPQGAAINPDSATGKVILDGKPILQLLTPEEFNASMEADNMLGNTSKISASLMYVPLAVGQKTIGVLSIQSYTQNAYNPSQVALVENIANQLASAIQNARLFEDVTRRAERERIVSDISSKIGSSFQTETILQTAAREISQLLEDADIFINLQPQTNETPEV